MTERAQRPRPERTRPNRDPNEILRGRAFRPEPDESASDPMTRSVGIGYKIVEQYLEQSRFAAAGVSPKSASAGGNILSDLTSRMVRTTADLFEVWFQLIDATGVAKAQAGTAAETAAAETPVQAAAVSSSVIVRIESSRAATVAVDLRPAPDANLVAHALRSDDASLPRIEGVRIEASAAGGPVTVSISVPADQPAGIYNGMVIDAATSLPVGTISVRIDAEPPRR